MEFWKCDMTDHRNGVCFGEQAVGQGVKGLRGNGSVVESKSSGANTIAVLRKADYRTNARA